MPDLVAVVNKALPHQFNVFGRYGQSSDLIDEEVLFQWAIAETRGTFRFSSF
jgi:hypothetical protein